MIKGNIQTLDGEDLVISDSAKFFIKDGDDWIQVGEVQDWELKIER